MMSCSVSAYDDASVIIHDLTRVQFDAFPGAEEVGEIQGHKFWSKHIRISRMVLNLHTNEPPVVPQFIIAKEGATRVHD